MVYQEVESVRSLFDSITEMLKAPELQNSPVLFSFLIHQLKQKYIFKDIDSSLTKWFFSNPLLLLMLCKSECMPQNLTEELRFSYNFSYIKTQLIFFLFYHLWV